MVMRVLIVLVALFVVCSAYPDWFKYGVFDLGQKIARRSSQQYTRLEPRGGSLTSGRGGFRPGFADDSLSNYLSGFDGRRKRAPRENLPRRIDFIIPSHLFNLIPTQE